MADVSLSSTNSTYSSGTIKWTGLASGTDFGSVVDQLVELERSTINRLETWRTSWSDKITSINKLNDRMTSLEDQTGSMDTLSDFYSRTSTSSNTGVVTTVNTSTAETGAHTVVVGSNIAGRVISSSLDEAAAVGGPAGGTLTIQVGSATLTLTEGVDYLATDTIDELAAKINIADANSSAGDILEDVTTVVDKTRDGTTYKRLIITAKAGGGDNAVSISDPTDLKLDENSIDAAYYESNWLSDADIVSEGEYTGRTNKTFTFRIANTGTIGQGDITVKWADDEGNSGSFAVKNFDESYEVFQGVSVKFTDNGNDQLFMDDSFTIDVFSPTLQAAQDSGLAQVEQIVHDGFVDLITPVTDTAAQFVYRYEGVETSVSIGSGAKLQDLVTAINSDPNNRGVIASIINDGQNTSTSYHLVLTGRDTGAEHSIEVLDTTTLTNFNVTDTFEISQRASNALVKIDGYPPTNYEYIQRRTNTVADVIDGMVLELRGVGTATITLSNDLSAMENKVKGFVDSVNFVLDYLREETKYNADSGESGVMIGNYTYDIVKSSINSILFEKIPGLDQENDPYVHLSQIGIKTDPDNSGVWTIDTQTLHDALSKDPEAVARLFVKDETYTLNSDEGGQGVAERLRDLMDKYTDSKTGIGNVLVNNYNGIISSIDDKIAREERRIAMVKDRLEQQFARLETLLGQLNGQSESLASQIKQLPNVGEE